jgi:hypothetical protein
MPELPRSAFRFDPELVRVFVQDRLDDAGRATLADEVARLLPFHPQLPQPVIADLVALTRHLGGDEALDLIPGVNPNGPALVWLAEQIRQLRRTTPDG